MNFLVVYFINRVLSNEKNEHAEEKEEIVATEETTNVGCVVNTRSCVYAT